jgi:hypothetical protein
MKQLPLLLLVYCMCDLVICMKPLFFSSILPRIPKNLKKLPKPELDNALYSRQLMVYGKSAQLKLFDSHIAIIGDSLLTNEVIKNLALSGIGKITIFQIESEQKVDLSILGEEENLKDYVHGLNSNVKVI